MVGLDLKSLFQPEWFYGSVKSTWNSSNRLEICQALLFAVRSSTDPVSSSCVWWWDFQAGVHAGLSVGCCPLLPGTGCIQLSSSLQLQVKGHNEDTLCFRHNLFSVTFFFHFPLFYFFRQPVLLPNWITRSLTGWLWALQDWVWSLMLSIFEGSCRLAAC